MRPDSNFVHRAEPKGNNSCLGRIDRGQPLYHGGIEPGDDGYEDPEFEEGMDSFDLKEPPKFTKGHKS